MKLDFSKQTSSYVHHFYSKWCQKLQAVLLLKQLFFHNIIWSQSAELDIHSSSIYSEHQSWTYPCPSCQQQSHDFNVAVLSSETQRWHPVITHSIHLSIELEQQGHHVHVTLTGSYRQDRRTTQVVCAGVGVGSRQKEESTHLGITENVLLNSCLRLTHQITFSVWTNTFSMYDLSQLS